MRESGRRPPRWAAPALIATRRTDQVRFAAKAKVPAAVRRPFRKFHGPRPCAKPRDKRKPVSGQGLPIVPPAAISYANPSSCGRRPALQAPAARVLDRDDVEPEILGIGRVQQPVVPAALYQSVRKHGRTILHTIGVVMDLAADINVRFGRRTASFEDQLAVTGVGGQVSSGGDSGSLVVDAVSRRPVALLFAGGLDITFAGSIGPVLDRFDADIL